MLKNLIICNDKMELEVMKGNIFALLLDGIITKEEYKDKMDRLFLRVGVRNNPYKKLFGR